MGWYKNNSYHVQRVQPRTVYRKRILNPSGLCRLCSSGGAMSFEAWMRDVDKHIYNVFGFDHDDFEDWRWMNAYTDGQTPEQAFEDWSEETKNVF